MKTTTLILIGLSTALVALSARAVPYVELPNGQKVAGSAIRALANGDINLTTEMGVRTFPKGSFLRAVADKPAEYDQAVAALKAAKYADAEKLLNTVATNLRGLSWDVEAMKLLPQALLGYLVVVGAVISYDILFLKGWYEYYN